MGHTQIEGPLEEHVIVDSIFSDIINAPLEQIDIPSWCFSLPDDDWRNFAIALTDPDFGEEKAQGCEIACLRHSTVLVFASRREAG